MLVLLQNPMTCSTPARLYQLRSKITISPAGGKVLPCTAAYTFEIFRGPKGPATPPRERPAGHALGDRLNGAALPRRLALEDDDHSLSGLPTQSCSWQSRT